MKIIVDADASPVKKEVIEVAGPYKIPVKFVQSFDHFSLDKLPKGVETLYVEAGNDAVDYKIVALANAGDIIVTQDYGLATLGLAKECIVLHHTGFQFTDEKMDTLMHTRYVHAKVRRSGKRIKGPKPFRKEHRRIFVARLNQILREKLKKATN